MQLNFVSMGAEDIRSAFEKTEGRWGKKVHVLHHFVSECE